MKIQFFCAWMRQLGKKDAWIHELKVDWGACKWEGLKMDTSDVKIKFVQKKDFCADSVEAVMTNKWTNSRLQNGKLTT